MHYLTVFLLENLSECQCQNGCKVTKSGIIITLFFCCTKKQEITFHARKTKWKSTSCIKVGDHIVHHEHTYKHQYQTWAFTLHMAKNPTPFHNHPFRGKHIKNTKSSLKIEYTTSLLLFQKISMISRWWL